MPRYSVPPFLAALAAALVLGCDHSEPTQPTDLPGDIPAPDLKSAASSSQFDPGDFTGVVDNRYLPWPPGTRFVYVGEEDGEPERDVTVVTHQKKTILGVDVVVVLDRVYQSGELTEQTFDWYAQDKKGNVWYFGEDSRTIEDGEVVSTEGSWEAGKNGARPGIIMPAHPHVGQTMQQEFAPGVAEDMARVLHLGLKVTVPYGSFNHCIETEEFTPLEPGVREVKFYCPGIGLVNERDVQGGTAHLALTRISR
jgi:hypothetical protein